MFLCIGKGEITWGDPHYILIAMANGARQLNYQGDNYDGTRVAWYHYIYPCDSQNQDAVDQWPFFLMSYVLYTVRIVTI